MFAYTERAKNEFNKYQQKQEIGEQIITVEELEQEDDHINAS
jgi:hypothetical protein